MNAKVQRPQVFYLRRAKTCRKNLLARVTPRTLHDFRTCLRRLEAFLRLEKPLLGKIRYRDSIIRIKNLRKWTGPLREAFVTSAILKTAGLSSGKKVLMPRGIESGKEKAFQTLLSERSLEQFFSNMESLLGDLDQRAERKKTQRIIRKIFMKEVSRLRQALKAYHLKGPGPEVLHLLRIRSKRLRYDLEQFDFLHPRRRKKLLKAVRRVHDALGRLRDLRTAEKGADEESLRILSAQENGLRCDAIESIHRLEKVMA